MSLDQLLDKTRKPKNVVTGVSMPSDVLRLLDEMAEHFDASRSAMVVALVKQEHQRLTDAGALT